MLSSERPPRIFSSSSTTFLSSSLNPSQKQQNHQQQQQQVIMRRGSSKNVTSATNAATSNKEYCYSNETIISSTPANNIILSSQVVAAASQGNNNNSFLQKTGVEGREGRSVGGCPREFKLLHFSNQQASSTPPKYCCPLIRREENNYSFSNNHYSHSLKESGEDNFHHRLKTASSTTQNRKNDNNSSGGEWHTSSCKFPAPRHTNSEIIHEVEVPIICVTSGDRRTSICSNLRFTRALSTDSIDSLERQCIKEVRRQRIMDEIELKDTHMLPPSSLLSPSNNGYPSLRDVGRSKTDPGAAESEGTTPIVQAKVITGFSFDSTKLSAQLSDIVFKRSNADLSIDGIKQRTLRDVMGVTVYQAKLLLQCWPNIYATGTSGSFASQLYSNLGKRNSKAKTLLTKADGIACFSQSDTDCTSMHIKLTLELLDTIIRSLDTNPTNIINYLTEIGQSHRNLKDEGMSTAMWDDLGDAILEGVRKNDLVRRHKELRRAWLAIIAFITDNIKQGHSSFRASPSTNDITNNDRNNKDQN